MQVPHCRAIFQQNITCTLQPLHKVKRLVRALLVSQLSVEFYKKRFVNVALCDQRLVGVRQGQ